MSKKLWAMIMSLAVMASVLAFVLPSAFADAVDCDNLDNEAVSDCTLTFDVSVESGETGETGDGGDGGEGGDSGDAEGANGEGGAGGAGGAG
ncbi:MAG: hypothetical protein ACRDIU_05955, partial [Actinomycetota bacterium]